MGYLMNEYTDMHLGPSLFNDFSISLSVPPPLLTGICRSGITSNWMCAL